MVIAYLRVSTEKQFLANQKEEIMRFAEKNGLSIDKWYTETVSGSVSTKDRKLSELLKRMHPGDTLIVTEISRLSRTLLEIMTILNFCIKKQVVLYSTKDLCVSGRHQQQGAGIRVRTDGGNRKEPDFDAYQRSSRTQKAGRNDFRPKERGYA